MKLRPRAVRIGSSLAMLLQGAYIAQADLGSDKPLALDNPSTIVPLKKSDSAAVKLTICNTSSSSEILNCGVASPFIYTRNETDPAVTLDIIASSERPVTITVLNTDDEEVVTFLRILSPRTISVPAAGAFKLKVSFYETALGFDKATIVYKIAFNLPKVPPPEVANQECKKVPDVGTYNGATANGKTKGSNPPKKPDTSLSDNPVFNVVESNGRAVVLNANSSQSDDSLRTAPGYIFLRRSAASPTFNIKASEKKPVRIRVFDAENKQVGEDSEFAKDGTFTVSPRDTDFKVEVATGSKKAGKESLTFGNVYSINFGVAKKPLFQTAFDLNLTVNFTDRKKYEARSAIDGNGSPIVIDGKQQYRITNVANKVSPLTAIRGLVYYIFDEDTDSRLVAPLKLLSLGTYRPGYTRQGILLGVGVDTGGNTDPYYQIGFAAFLDREANVVASYGLSWQRTETLLKGFHEGSVINTQTLPTVSGWSPGLFFGIGYKFSFGGS